MDTEVLAEKLTVFEKRLAEQYFNDGLKSGSAAYRKLRPNVTDESSRALASGILSKPHVQEYLDTLSFNPPETNVGEAHSIKKEFVKKVKRITDKAENKEQYSAALKGCELEARVEGLFSQEDTETNQYLQFFDKVSITVNNVPASVRIEGGAPMPIATIGEGSTGAEHE